MPQARVKATDLIMVQVATGNLEGSHNETEAKDSNNSKPYFQGNQTNSYRGQGHGHGPQQFRGCGHGRPNYQNSNGAYQYQYYTHDPQSEQYGPPAVYAADSITPLSIVTRENKT